jgi:arabinose-5-phosphate isomerase
MEGNPGFLDVPVENVMTRTPKLARVGELASAAVHSMEKHGIMALPVVGEGDRLEGIVHLHDLLRSGVV